MAAGTEGVRSYDQSRGPVDADLYGGITPVAAAVQAIAISILRLLLDAKASTALRVGAHSARSRGGRRHRVRCDAEAEKTRREARQR